MTDRVTHKTTITNDDGKVYVSLPNGGYMELTPEQARQIAARLFTHAADALGEARPDTILLTNTGANT